MTNDELQVTNGDSLKIQNSKFKTHRKIVSLPLSKVSVSCSWDFFG